MTSFISSSERHKTDLSEHDNKAGGVMEQEQLPFLRVRG